MGNRIELQAELVKFMSNVYFQPPSNITISYPCIVYSKTQKSTQRANDGMYLSKQGYQITLIEKNPDSEIANEIESHFQYCEISQHFVTDNLHHTTLNLYY
jgi:hypothetical protein